MNMMIFIMPQVLGASIRIDSVYEGVFYSSLKKIGVLGELGK